MPNRNAGKVQWPQRRYCSEVFVCHLIEVNGRQDGKQCILKKLWFSFREFDRLRLEKTAPSNPRERALSMPKSFTLFLKHLSNLNMVAHPIWNRHAIPDRPFLATIRNRSTFLD